jgi:DNA gyrase subunit A
MKGKRAADRRHEIPYQQFRDRVVERSPRWSTRAIKGISGIRDESDLKEPVRLVIELKRDADPDVVLNQLYQFSPLQDTFSLIFLALVDGKPRELTLKEMLEEFIRHRVTVIRRRTQFLLAKARRASTRSKGCCWRWPTSTRSFASSARRPTQPEAKQRLMGIECPRR